MCRLGGEGKRGGGQRAETTKEKLKNRGGGQRVKYGRGEEGQGGRMGKGAVW